MEGKGYETRQSSLMYVFVRFSGVTTVANKNVWLRDSCIMYERKTKIAHGRGPSNVNFGIFVCSFDACRAS